MTTARELVNAATAAGAKLATARGAGRARCVFSLELDPGTISGLVELGWLSGRQRDDRAAVIDGFCRFIGFALDMTRNTRR